MPDPTLGRVQDTGHAGIRQGFQSIVDSLNQNSQMAINAIENWKQRDYATKEAEKGRLFQAEEALKTRTHEAEQKGLDRKSNEKITDKDIQSKEKIARQNNETSKYVADVNAATQKAISAAKNNHQVQRDSLLAGIDLRETYQDENGKTQYRKNTDGSYLYGHNKLVQTPNTPQQPPMERN